MKWGIGLLLALGLAILLAVTNPSIHDFRDYVQVQVQQALNQSDGFTKTAVGVGKLFGYDAAGSQTDAIMRDTRRTDWVIASRYDLRIDDHPYAFIGILNRFVPIDAPAN